MSEPGKENIVNKTEDTFWGRCDLGSVAAGPFKFPAPHWQDDGTCSHCGGIRPSLALEAIRRGAEVEPTDKNYKIYVRMANPNSGKTRIWSGRNYAPREGETGWLKVDDALKAKHPKLDFDGIGGWVQLGPDEPVHTVKCYFNHFSESQAVEFVTLSRSGKMKIAHPGNFYSGMCFGVYKVAIEAALKQPSCGNS